MRPVLPFVLALVLADCAALWGLDELSYDDPGTATDGGGGGGGGHGGAQQGGSTATGGAAGSGGAATPCAVACNTLFDCGLETPSGGTGPNCPGFVADQRDIFLYGCNGEVGCIASCEVMPTLVALVDPSNCIATVQNIANANPDFASACQVGALCFNPDGGTGGSGGG